MLTLTPAAAALLSYLKASNFRGFGITLHAGQVPAAIELYNARLLDCGLDTDQPAAKLARGAFSLPY